MRFQDYPVLQKRKKGESVIKHRLRLFLFLSLVRVFVVFVVLVFCEWKRNACVTTRLLLKHSKNQNQTQVRIKAPPAENQVESSPITEHGGFHPGIRSSARRNQQHREGDPRGEVGGCRLDASKAISSLVSTDRSPQHEKPKNNDK